MAMRTHWFITRYGQMDDIDDLLRLIEKVRARLKPGTPLPVTCIEVFQEFIDDNVDAISHGAIWNLMEAGETEVIPTIMKDPISQQVMAKIRGRLQNVTAAEDYLAASMREHPALESEQMLCGFIAVVIEEFLRDGTLCSNFGVMFERLLEISEKDGRSRTVDEYIQETYNEFSGEMSTATREEFEYVGQFLAHPPTIYPDGTLASDALNGFGSMAASQLARRSLRSMFRPRTRTDRGLLLWKDTVEQT